MPVHRKSSRFVDPAWQLTEKGSQSQSAKHFPNHCQPNLDMLRIGKAEQSHMTWLFGGEQDRVDEPTAIDCRTVPDRVNGIIAAAIPG